MQLEREEEGDAGSICFPEPQERKVMREEYQAEYTQTGLEENENVLTSS